MCDWSEQADDCVVDRDDCEDGIDIGNAFEVERRNIPFKIDRRASIYRSLTPFERDIMGAFERAGLGPRIWCLAAGGSCYIKFGESRLRSLRIGDHRGRKKYRYKWNLRVNYKMFKREQDGKVVRFYYPILEYNDMVRHMVMYRNKILRDDDNKKNLPY